MDGAHLQETQCNPGSKSKNPAAKRWKQGAIEVIRVQLGVLSPEFARNTRRACKEERLGDPWAPCHSPPQ